MTAKVFLSHQINALAKLYNVVIITNLNRNKSSLDNMPSNIEIIDLPLKRDIDLIMDLKALFLLTLIFFKNDFQLVHSVSPKAGLLTSIAARIARIPNRLHTFTGQVWSTKIGLSRWFLKSLDKIIVTLNNVILVDSPSQRNFLIEEKVISKETCIVLGDGSISGVDINRFIPSLSHRNSIRQKLNIDTHDIIFLFVGRLKREKGLFELVESFKDIRAIYCNVTLLIIGPDEEKIKQELLEYIGPYKSSAKFVDFTKYPEHYMAASDIFVLPSYREGFGSVVIEAAACGLPSIGSNIYGLSDAIHHQKTGLLVPSKSSKHLRNAMLKLAFNDRLRIKMGLNARSYAIKFFSQKKITSLLLQLYKSLI